MGDDGGGDAAEQAPDDTAPAMGAETIRLARRCSAVSTIPCQVGAASTATLCDWKSCCSASDAPMRRSCAASCTLLAFCASNCRSSTGRVPRCGCRSTQRTIAAPPGASRSPACSIANRGESSRRRRRGSGAEAAGSRLVDARSVGAFTRPVSSQGVDAVSPAAAGIPGWALAGEKALEVGCLGRAPPSAYKATPTSAPRERARRPIQSADLRPDLGAAARFAAR